MGFCTANSIDLINMTSSGDECARQGTNAAGSKRDNFAAGERAMSGPRRAAEGLLSYPVREGRTGSLCCERS